MVHREQANIGGSSSPTLPEAIVSLRQVTKSFLPRSLGGAAYVALEQVALEVRSGEFFCLLGPSGCGKTTLLNLIAGFEPADPDSGEIFAFGRPVKGPDSTRAVVFQSDRALFDWLTVEENASFGPRMRGIPENKWRPIVEEKLALVGVAAHRDKLPRELSGGMKQRVQVARVLANEPKLLLMDEPFAALDAYTRGRMQREISRIWAAEKKTVIFVTHDIAEAIWLADRIGIMTQGPRSHVKRIVEVPLPRPREKMTPEFSTLFNTLSTAIDEESRAQQEVV